MPGKSYCGLLPMQVHLQFLFPLMCLPSRPCLRAFFLGPALGLSLFLQFSAALSTTNLSVAMLSVSHERECTVTPLHLEKKEP